MDSASDWAMVQSGIPGKSRPWAAPLEMGSNPTSQPELQLVVAVPQVHAEQPYLPACYPSCHY